MSSESRVMEHLLPTDLRALPTGYQCSRYVRNQELGKTAAKADLKFQMLQYCRELGSEGLGVIERVPL